MEVEINAPWGNTMLDTEKPLSVIKYGLKQLEYYRDFNFNKTLFLKEDIQGYEKILSSTKPKENAGNFLKEKSRIKNLPTKKIVTNLQIINYMQKNKNWSY